MTNTILVTGASSGIGKSTAEHFHQLGWNVAATMRNPDGSDFDHDERLLTTRLDVTDLDSIDTAVAATIDRFGRIDVLVNNAGYGTQGALEAIPRDAMLRQLNRRGGPTVAWDHDDLQPDLVQAGMVIDEDLKAESGMLLLRHFRRAN